MSYLWKILLCIFVLSGLLAIYPTVKIARSVPCMGIVTSVSYSESERRDSDGQSYTDTKSYHRVAYKHPVTGAWQDGNLMDISAGENESIPLLYDPSDQSISLNRVTSLYGTSLWTLGTLLVLWLIVLIAVRSD